MPRRKKEEQDIPKVKKIKTPSLVNGTRDILTSDYRYWEFILKAISKLADDYSFKRMSTPLLEKYEMFNHVLGKNSEFINKETFSFVDRGEKLMLRPELTTSIMRAYIDHSLFNQNLPLKAFYIGEVFRQGRVSSTNLRQFTQVGFEIIGDDKPSIDSELIILLYQFFKGLGLDTTVELNSNGCLCCRSEYEKNLVAYLKTKRTSLCASCRRDYSRKPYKFLRCESNKCLKVKEEAPQIVDWLCEGCQNHLFKVLEYLDELKVNYNLNYLLVRPFEYYSKTVFNFLPKEKEGEKKANYTLASGGRYDKLAEMLSGPETPAVGVAFGVERLISALKNNKFVLPDVKAPDVYLAQIGEQAKRKALAFFEELRSQKFSVKADFSQNSLKYQLDRAVKLGARVVLILGQKEALEGTILIRDVESGIQEVINYDKAIAEVKKKLKELRKKKK